MSKCEEGISLVEKVNEQHEEILKLKAQRDHYKAQAEKFRKALYQIRNICCVEGDAAGRMLYEVADIALQGDEE